MTNTLAYLNQHKWWSFSTLAALISFSSKFNKNKLPHVLSYPILMSWWLNRMKENIPFIINLWINFILVNKLFQSDNYCYIIIGFATINCGRTIKSLTYIFLWSKKCRLSAIINTVAKYVLGACHLFCPFKYRLDNLALLVTMIQA